MNSELKQHLKITTYPLHEWLESSPLFDSIKSKELSKEEYIELLKKMAGFISNIEQIIKTYKEEFEKHNLNDIEKRVEKTQWLKDDLKELGIEFSSKKIEFNTLSSFSSVVGALYVLEGSTMGGMQIVKMMKKNTQEDLPTNYYQSYKQETMPMWMAFAKWLDEIDVDKYEVTLGAMETFIKLKKHIDSK